MLEMHFHKFAFLLKNDSCSYSEYCIFYFLWRLMYLISFLSCLGSLFLYAGWLSVFLVVIEAHGEDKNYVAFLALSHLLFAFWINATDTMERRDAFFKWVTSGACRKHNEPKLEMQHLSFILVCRHDLLQHFSWLLSDDYFSKVDRVWQSWLIRLSSHCKVHLSLFIMMPFHHSRHLSTGELLAVN